MSAPACLRYSGLQASTDASGRIETRVLRPGQRYVASLHHPHTGVGASVSFEARGGLVLALEG